MEVKELSNLKDIKEDKKLIYHKVNSDGIEWILDVRLKCGEKRQGNETSNFIKANLYSDIGQRIKLIDIKIFIKKNFYL